MRKHGMSTRAMKRKTGIDLKEVASLMKQVEDMVASEGRKVLPNTRLTVEKADVMKAISVTLADLKRELGQEGPRPDSTPHTPPIVRFQ